MGYLIAARPALALVGVTPGRIAHAMNPTSAVPRFGRKVEQREAHRFKRAVDEISRRDSKTEEYQAADH
jgi:hypothetical protein